MVIVGWLALVLAHAFDPEIGTQSWCSQTTVSVLVQSLRFESINPSPITEDEI